jgi:hypothetical protein
VSPPDLPRDPAEYRPRPLIGVTFWAMIALCVLCVLAGAAVAMFAPRMLRHAPPVPAPAPAAPATVSPAAAVPAAPPAPPDEPDEIARLNARIAALENQGAKAGEAAVAALTLAELVEATRGSQPFARELASLRAAAPGLPELTQLARFADLGAPSRAALAVSFEDVAPRAASRARKPPPGAGFGDRVAYAAAKVVTVRRVDDLTGTTPDALIARAEHALADGDVTAALRLLDALPPKSREAIAPWRAGAERRAEIDRAVASLRSRAARDLRPAAAAT